VLAGELTLADAGRELSALVTRVAAGELSKPEQLGHREYFVMYKHQETPSLAAGCRA
jgi:altronate dehydratase large subunit